MRIANEDDMFEAARKLREMGARAVLVKGGHLKERLEARARRSVQPRINRDAGDLLDDQGDVTFMLGEWIDSAPVRGTGCMLSSAIAACLGLGMDLKASVSSAQRFVAEMIRYAPQLGLIRLPVTRS